MTGLLIDLDGVLYEGERPVPGAADAVRWLDRSGIPHLFLTNTTSRPRAALVEKLAKLGIDTRAESILTPPVAADRWLADHAPGPAALFVPPATAEEFRSVPHLLADAEQGAASVVLGDLGEGWSFPVMNRAFRLLMAEPRPVLVALGMTRYWRAADGLRLDVAFFAKGLEHVTGAETVVLGKPATPFFETALEMLGCDAEDAVMVGDDIVGDVKGAQAAGLRGILVRTGKFRAEDLEGEIRPHAVLDSIAALARWWEPQVQG
jgi:phospholysine phosphohistidine inorganic pyrophosphate phosphatase